MATTTMYKLKLDAVPDASNCLVLRLQGGTSPLPSLYTFYTGTFRQVEVTVFFPMAGGSLYFAGTTYSDSDGNNVIVVQCAVSGEIEIEAISPSSATPTVTRAEEADTTESPSHVAPPLAPGVRVRLMPKIGYPPSGGGDD
jgi:hypothetical protein